MAIDVSEKSVKGHTLNGKLEFLPFVNPATGEQFGSVAMATAVSVKQARREMGAAATVWAAKPVAQRVAILRQLQALMIDEMDEITAVINRDTGKSRQDALTEVFVTVDLLNTYCKQAANWLKSERVSPGLQIFKRAYLEKVPYGTAAVIGPWNYPFLLIFAPIISALLAGNTVFVKPSEVTAATGVMMEELVNRIPALSPFVRFLHGDGRVGAALVESQPDIIFLTGSTRTGRLVSKAAAELMIPVISELGGKDAMIVLEDANLEAAAHWGAWGATYNTGQTCMAVERIYVVDAVYDAFLKELVDYTRKIKVGYSPDRFSPLDMGPLTFQRQIDIVEEHVQDALDKGAQIIMGGQRDGLFMQPAVMVNVDHSMKIMQEETFGPIIPVMRVDNETHAIQLANHSDFGLSASVWSEDLARARRVAKSLHVGSVNINDTMSHFGVPQLPFGGVKASGTGRTHGKYDMLQFTQTRSVMYGKVPWRYDIATILREPGQYKLAAAIMRLALGVTPQQRLQPVVELLEEKDVKPQVGKLAAALGATAVATTVLLSLFKRLK